MPPRKKSSSLAASKSSTFANMAIDGDSKQSVDMDADGSADGSADEGEHGTEAETGDKRKKGGTGRRRIEIGEVQASVDIGSLGARALKQLQLAEYIKDKHKRTITFSKRKAGIFTKVRLSAGTVLGRTRLISAMFIPHFWHCAP